MFVLNSEMAGHAEKEANPLYPVPRLMTGKELEKRLDEVHITANKNTVPNDPQSPFITSGVRLGTPAVTTRGFKEPEMLKIAKWISDAVNDFDNSKERIAAEVSELCSHFPIY